MPRYHFETQDGRRHPDAHGLELNDLAEAKDEAIRATCEVVREYAEEFWKDGDFMMTVKDDSGLVLFCLNLSYTAAPALFCENENKALRNP